MYSRNKDQGLDYTVSLKKNILTKPTVVVVVVVVGDSEIKLSSC